VGAKRKTSSKYEDENWLGTKFNSLTVIDFAGPSVDKSIYYWITKCDCGNEHRTIELSTL
jgi:hypothetical protein